MDERAPVVTPLLRPSRDSGSWNSFSLNHRYRRTAPGDQTTTEAPTAAWVACCSGKSTIL